MTATHARRSLKRRLLSLVARRALVESLEPRLLLDAGPPYIVSHDLPAQSDVGVSAATLVLSEAVVGEDARDSASYRLVRLGADQLLGGDDDVVQQVTPAYTDGTTQIDLDLTGTLTPFSLGDWTAVKPSGGWGGYWLTDVPKLKVDTAGSLVSQ